jgi:hypothetical protein
VVVPVLAIEFVKGSTRRYRSVLHRADGVEIELDGGSYNKIGGPAGEVPHDIAHLVVEDELGLEHGVWGILAAGGLFRGASVRAGRQRPHAARRGQEILRASVEQLNQAEVLTRAVCDLALAGSADLARLRAATGRRWWSPTATDDALARAIRRLSAAGEQWAELAAGESLRGSWTQASSRRRAARA